MALCLKCRLIQQTHWVKNQINKGINTRTNWKISRQGVQSNGKRKKVW